MEMHQIRYFLAVADALNFTRAAEHCNVTQPALTRAIQKLEEELGGLLFHRERAHTQLTDLGRLMRPHLEQILNRTEAAKTTAHGFLTLDNANLNLGVMCTIGPMRSIGFLAHFEKHHPGISLSLLETTPRHLSDQLLDGTLDIAMFAQPDPIGDRFHVQPLYRERFVVLFPPGHRFAAKNAIEPADLNGEHYLQRINCEHGPYMKEKFSERGMKITVAYRSEREDWIQTMVAAGMGIAVVPEYSPLLPGLLIRPIIEPEVVREISLVTVAGRRFSPATAAFVRAAKAYRWQRHDD